GEGDLKEESGASTADSALPVSTTEVKAEELSPATGETEHSIDSVNDEDDTRE
ncbi:uncharacterized protein METZ01_LOCUS201053, partial [marine metagenome]